MPEHDVCLVGVVLELGSHFPAHDFLVAIAARGKAGANAFEHATEFFHASLDGKHVAARRQLDLSLLDERNAVPGVVVAVARADETVVTRPREADVAEAAARLGVL